MRFLYDYRSNLIPRRQFLGDVTQPLHASTISVTNMIAIFIDFVQVEALEVGGNDISAKCSGTSTNLHAVCYRDFVTF